MNSICHRDYSILGTDIQVKIFDEHITVESPGMFPGLVRPANIRHTHFSRNPKIAAYMHEYKLVKEFGEGVDRMFREMEEAGNPAPEFKQQDFMVLATIRENSSAVTTESELTGQVAGQVKDSIRRLILALGDKTLTRKQIMELLSLKGRDNFRVNYLEPAMEEGIVLKLYPDSGNRPDQAYYLTEKGLKLWAELK